MQPEQKQEVKKPLVCPTDPADMIKDSFIIIRTAFITPLTWKAGMELVKRGKYEVMDEVKHWFWEWKLIVPIMNDLCDSCL